MAASLDGYTGLKYFLVSSPVEHVAHVQTNRPEKLNAFFDEMWLEMGRIFRKLSHDANVRAVVFSAVGERAFTSGLDVQATSEGGTLSPAGSLDAARFATRVRRHVYEIQESISAIEQCEKRMFLTPTNACSAIHG
ncbi:putative enoyl hydratase-like protein [Rosellinia necatrix]|uniref:Putative enoyl hydratase-like protein n=1 Tax=Rosellinia necatrix TaxID=77044 RepID=A0A1S8A587_ROSNE|nr:putative enoyl hydratase-like protein [Rosellinia necatrix]